MRKKEWTLPWSISRGKISHVHSTPSRPEWQSTFRLFMWCLVSWIHKVAGTSKANWQHKKVVMAYSQHHSIRARMGCPQRQEVGYSAGNRMHQQSTFLFFLILHPLFLHRPLKQNGQACRIFDFLWKCFFIDSEPLASSSNALVLPKSGISFSPLCSGWPTVTSHSRSWLLRPACHRSPKEVFLISTCPQWLVLCGTSVFKPPS